MHGCIGIVWGICEGLPEQESKLLNIPNNIHEIITPCKESSLWRI